MLYVQMLEAPMAEYLHSPGDLGSYSLSPPPWSTEPIHGPETNTRYIVTFVSGSYGNKAQLDFNAIKKLDMLIAGGSHWWTHVSVPHAPTDVDSITTTVDEVLDFIAAFGPESLSLSGLHPASVQGEHLAALLRASSTWRDQISGWHDALNVARLAIELADQDPEDALFGMI